MRRVAAVLWFGVALLLAWSSLRSSSPVPLEIIAVTIAIVVGAGLLWIGGAVGLIAAGLGTVLGGTGFLLLPQVLGAACFAGCGHQVVAVAAGWVAGSGALLLVSALAAREIYRGLRSRKS